MYLLEKRIIQLQPATQRNILFGDLCVNISCISICINPLGTTTMTHCHEFYEFLLLLEGKQYMTVLGNEHLNDTGNFTLIPPGVLHSHRDCLGWDSRGVVVRFTAQKVMTHEQVVPVADKLLATLSIPHVVPLTDPDVTKVFAEPTREGLYERASLDMLSLLFCVAEAFSRDENIARSGPRPRIISDQALVENVLMSISTMYMTDFDVTQLARIHNISYRHLARIFVNITGYTLGEWTMYTRIYSSMEFLVETSMPIAAIAKQVGFSSESYFSSIFSRTVGIAPTVFRKAQAGGPMVAPALDDMPGVGGPKRNKLYNPFQPHLADTTRIQFITQGHSL